MTFPTTAENLNDVAHLKLRLAEVAISEVVTYAQLDAVVGRPVRNRRYLLERAKDELNAETGVIFESVFNVGYRRMPIMDVPLVGVRTRRRIRRIAHRHIKRMSSAVRLTNRVPQKASLGINKEIAVLGVIAAIARDSVAAKGAPEETAKGVANLPPPIAVVAQRLIDALR